MKKIVLTLAIILIAFTAAIAQHSAKRYNISDLRGVRAGWTFQFEIEEGTSDEILIIAPTQTLECLIIKNNEGILSLDLDFSKAPKMDGKNANKNRDETTMVKNNRVLIGPIKVKMQLSKLEAIILSGSAKIDTKGTFKGGKLICMLSGASKVDNTKISVEKLDAKLSGAVNASFTGSYRTIDLEMSGASKLSAEGDFYKGDISLSGSSALTLNGKSNSLDLELSGASKITLSGSTQTCEIESSGAGKIDGNNFTIKAAEVELSGASSLYIKVLQSLKAKLSGASRMQYNFKGEDENLKIEQGGATKVTKM